MPVTCGCRSVVSVDGCQCVGLVAMLPTQLKPQAGTLLSLLPEVARAFPVWVVAEQSPLWTAM